MNRPLILTSTAFMLLLPQFKNVVAAGAYDGEWTGIATSTGERCKRGVVKLTVKGQVVLGQAKLNAMRPTSTELLTKTARLGGR